jgi:hypothetical protein
MEINALVRIRIVILIRSFYFLLDKSVLITSPQSAQFNFMLVLIIVYVIRTE